MSFTCQTSGLIPLQPSHLGGSRQNLTSLHLDPTALTVGELETYSLTASQPVSVKTGFLSPHQGPGWGLVWKPCPLSPPSASTLSQAHS